MLYSLRNDKILLEEKDFIRLQSSNILHSSKFSEITIEEMSLSQSSTVNKLLGVFAYFETRLLYISMVLQIENILISEGIIILNIECLNGQETMVLNFVTSWGELQRASLSIRLLE